MSTLNVKVDFRPGVSSPQEILQCAVDTINALSELDQALASCLSTSMRMSFKLEGFKEGSLITRLKSFYLNEDSNENIDDRMNIDTAQSFVDKSRDGILKGVNESNEKIDGKRLIDILSVTETVAEQVGIKDAIGYTPPNPMIFSKAINSVLESSDRLGDGEKAKISTSDEFENESLYVDLPRGKKVDVDDVLKELVTKEIENTLDMILVIKKPDFLGDSQWEFKKGKESLSAKIEDSEWVSKFKSGEVVIVPNDALHVDLNEKALFDKHGVALSIKRTITKVKERIRGEKHE